MRHVIRFLFAMLLATIFQHKYMLNPANSELLGPPLDAGSTAMVPRHADIRILFPYGKKYRRSWKHQGKRSPTHHNGIDFVRKRTRTVGTNVISATFGRVTRAVNLKCVGSVILIATPFELNGKQVFAFYAHLNERYVQVGSKIKIGDIIGTILEGNIRKRPCQGNTGHLHFALTTSPRHAGLEPYNPNRFWQNGIGLLTCFDASEDYDVRSFELVSPFGCDANDGNRRHLPVWEKIKRFPKSSVVKVQELTKQRGYYEGKIDGVYGAKSQRAVKICYLGGKCKISELMSINPMAIKAESEKSLKPDFVGDIVELRTLLANGNSSAVLKWQEYLASLGYYFGNIDGKYNKRMRMAIGKCNWDDNCLQ